MRVTTNTRKEWTVEKETGGRLGIHRRWSKVADKYMTRISCAPPKEHVTLTDSEVDDLIEMLTKLKLTIQEEQ